MKFDDSLWDHVWERNLNHVERHTIAMTVWRRERPDTTFDLLVALELARRWRRHTRYLIALYGLWTLFWASITFHALRAGVEASPLSTGCAVFGLLVIAMCLVARRWLASYLRLHAVETT
jgi:hypothetical protein